MARVRTNQKIGWTNRRATNLAPEVAFSRFRALSRPQPTLPLWCSLFQARRKWGRRESKRYAKRGGTGRPSSSPFPPVIFPCSRFLNPRGPNYLGAWNRVALLLNPLSSADAPSGYPPKNSNNEKKRKRARDEGRGKRPLFFLSPFHRAPRAFFFFLPSLPTTQKGLCGVESRAITVKRLVCTIREHFSLKISSKRHSILKINHSS